jgi:hypothetical protein
MIMGEFHMIPLKINNYNHMKTLLIIAFIAALTGLIVSLVVFFKLMAEKRHSYARNNSKYFGD